jgi:hypothetical protein
LLTNAFTKKKVKFDVHKKALEFFTLNGFMTKFDLKSGYRHVDIFPEHIGNIWDLVGLLETAYKDISTLTCYRLGCAPL